MNEHHPFHPVSHHLLRDPEFIELRLKFDDWMGFVWLDMLAWGDRTGGVLKGDRESIGRSLSTEWLSNSKRYNTEWRANKVGMALEWMQDKGWIRIESGSITILNYAKYHKRRDPTSHRQTAQAVAPPPNPPNLTEPNLLYPPFASRKKGNGEEQKTHPNIKLDYHIGAGDFPWKPPTKPKEEE